MINNQYIFKFYLTGLIYTFVLRYELNYHNNELYNCNHTLKKYFKTFFLQKLDENPQDILDTLPPLPQEEEPELSPELKEGI